ncbi:MAG: TonB-dependent receptor [candidate division WOR-3 bacterium]|nr:TonB-dependent receptor [candidate division WOR-3 bacterium]
MIPLIMPFLIIGQIYEVEGVVVTAPRYPGSLKDISGSIMVIDKEVLKSSSFISLAEALRNLTSIDVKEYGSPGSVSSISIRGTPSSGVLVLLDGIPLNSMQTGIADISWVDINDIERIEIIKTPVSNLYGANGIGGVVNIITTRNEDSNPGKAKVKHELGTTVKKFHNEEYYLAYTIPKENFGYKIAGKKSSGEGGRTNSECDEFFMKNQIFYNHPLLKIQFGTYLDLKDYGIPGPKPLVNSLHPAPVLGDSSATSKFDNEIDRIWLNNLLLSFKILKNLVLNSTIFSNLHNTQYHTRYMGWGVVEEDYNYSLITAGINNSLLWEWKQDKIALGFDYRYDTLRAEKTSLQTGDTLWSAHAENYAGWILLIKRLLKRLTLNLGLRYDKNSSYGGFFSPSLGIITEVNPRLWLKLSFSRAFRAPGFNDLYWPIYGNKDLKPEYGNAYELRIESSPIYTMFTGFSIFLRDIKDRITWLPTQEGLWKPQNVNLLRTIGMESEINLKLNDNLRMGFDCTYLFARQRNRELIYYDFTTQEMRFEEKERKAAFIPELILGMRIGYTVAKDFLLTVSTQYTSRRFNYYENWTSLPDITIDTKELKPCYLINLNICRRFFKHLKFSSGIKNLLNYSYSVQFGNSMDDKDYPMPGRTYFAEISWD